MIPQPVNSSAKPLRKLNDAEAERMIMDSFFDDEAAGIPSSDAMVADEDATAAGQCAICSLLVSPKLTLDVAIRRDINEVVWERNHRIPSNSAAEAGLDNRCSR